MTLEELYNELGTLKWAGSDEGWDLAIEAVRKLLKEEVIKDNTSKAYNAFGLSEEDIEEIHREFERIQPGIITTPEPDNLKPIYIQPKNSFQPCLLDNVPSGTITNVACSCPKCSPKC